MNGAPVKTVVTNPLAVTCRYPWAPTHGITLEPGQSRTFDLCVYTAATEVGKKMMASDISLGRVNVAILVQHKDNKWERISIEEVVKTTDEPAAAAKTEAAAEVKKPGRRKKAQKDYVAPDGKNEDTPRNPGTFDEVFTSKTAEEMKPKAENLFANFESEPEQIARPESVELFAEVAKSTELGHDSLAAPDTVLEDEPVDVVPEAEAEEAPAEPEAKAKKPARRKRKNKSKSKKA